MKSRFQEVLRFYLLSIFCVGMYLRNLFFHWMNVIENDEDNAEFWTAHVRFNDFVTYVKFSVFLVSPRSTTIFIRCLNDGWKPRENVSFCVLAFPGS